MGTWTVPAGQQYYLTTSVSPSGGGTILPASGWYNSGSQVTITATPYSGYQFSGFTGTVNSGSNPLTVTMNSAMTETANFVPTSQYTATSIADLNNCIQNLTQFTTCALAPGTYTVTSTINRINITRGNVSVTGGSGDRTQTKLVRDAAFTEPIIRVDAPTPGTCIPGNPTSCGITIQNLTVCGSGTLAPSSSGCPRAQTICGTMVDRITQYYPDDPPEPYPILGVPDFICTDVEIAQANTGLNTTTPDPFNYTGPYSVTIANVDLEDATGHALALYANATEGKKVNDVYIHDSAVNSSAVTGVLVGVEGESYADPRACDNKPNFINDTTLYAPRNIRIEGNNKFQNNLTGAVAFNAGRWLALRDNKAPSGGFENNYIQPQVGNGEGGTVFFDKCADTIQIHDNTFARGTSTYPQTDGLELWGRNIDVRRNEVSGYPTEGIGANSVFSLHVLDNNQTLNNNTHPAGQRGGILVWTSGSGGGCDPTPRDTDVVEISGNTSTGNAYGILLGDRYESRNTIKNVTISGDNVLQTPAVGLHSIVTLSGNINIAPGTTPVQSDPAPGALEIGPRCSAAATRQVFTFSVSDVDMPGNIRYIEGVFSVPGNDDTGIGGPDAPACYFLYFYNVPGDPSLNNKLFLDDPNTFWSWPWSSILGPEGTDLNNGFCTIRTGLSQAATEAKILKLTLDVQFLSSLADKKHMYLVAIDNDGLSSHSGEWKYSGWWSTQ
ncbi:MAG: hypothetical protein HYS04_16980 [Acidobacteria bacterium]|nr:hypothetical protein [Acidobacteriota bacterium]